MNCITIRRIAIGVGFAAAFGAGFHAARLLPDPHLTTPAYAQAMAPQIINVPGLTPDDLGKASPTGFRSKTFVTADGATVAVQSGFVAKHLHPNTNEIQYIVEGSGKFWLDDKEHDIKPGDLIVIPKGTPHANNIATSGTFKAIAIKTPPQIPGDTKMLP